MSSDPVPSSSGPGGGSVGIGAAAKYTAIRVIIIPSSFNVDPLKRPRVLVDAKP